MKKWSGGVLILGLAFILVVRYSSIGKQTQKWSSAYEFFHTHPQDVHSTQGENVDNKSIRMEGNKLQHTRRRPHFINVAGLDYLFNSSYTANEQESMAWRQMLRLLSRSDALPETALGIKEAATAWRELVSTIEEERASNSLHRKGQNCPFSVSAVNDSNFLEIPCGLVEDSSVTVIAIPDGKKDGFQIELVGSKMQEELNPPVILLYNVFLPGDNFTKEPAIIQNSWTKEDGWGKEERCPNHGSVNNAKVDALVKCNEQLIRSSVGESLHGIGSNDNKSTNVSDGSAHIGASFPFSEGSPFTATIWAGAEGFHVTVNGRHETSFEYREVRNLNHGC